MLHRLTKIIQRVQILDMLNGESLFIKSLHNSRRRRTGILYV